MDTEKVKTFLTLADTLSFTKTANLLHKSQSVVSRHILSIEAEVGFPLFIRDSRFCSLTPAGERYAEGLRKLSDQYDLLVGESLRIHKGVSGALKIGIHNSEINGQYLSIIANFRDLYPNTSVSFVDYRDSELNERMQKNEIDLAQIVTEGYWFMTNRTYYKYILCGIRHICLYIHKSHPLFRTESSRIRLKDFENDTFLVFSGFEPNSDSGPTARLLAENGIRPSFRACETLSSAIMTMEAGGGVLLSANHLSIAGNADFRKIYFPSFGTQNEALAWIPDNPNPCIGVFINFLKKYIQKNPTILSTDPFYP